MATTATDITKSEAGQKLQELLAEMIAAGRTDILQQGLADVGLVAVVKDPAAIVKTTRKATVAKWTEPGAELSEEETEVLVALPQTLGLAPTFATPADVRQFTQEEQDTLVHEATIERRAEDILKGRCDEGIGRTVKLYANKFFGGPNDEAGEAEILSPKHGKKIDVYLSTKTQTHPWEFPVEKPNFAMLERLVHTFKDNGNSVCSVVLPILSKEPIVCGQPKEAHLSRKTWESITDEVTHRVVNDAKLTQALGDNKVLMASVEALDPPTITVQAWTVRDLKGGEKA